MSSGGYFVLEANNLDEAIEIAARIPSGALRRFGRDPTRCGATTLIEHVFRDEWSRVLAALIGVLGDFELAEEADQEAFAIAAKRWPRAGTPDNPGAWLLTTARNRAIDRLRRRAHAGREDTTARRADGVRAGSGRHDDPR